MRGSSFVFRCAVVAIFSMVTVKLLSFENTTKPIPHRRYRTSTHWGVDRHDGSLLHFSARSGINIEPAGKTPVEPICFLGSRGKVGDNVLYSTFSPGRNGS